MRVRRWLLTVLELVFHPLLEGLPLILQTLLLSAAVVPTVGWLLMPRLHKDRARLFARSA
ncbi:hypothetical protein SSPIM334S_04577 [Streptomyces spiroverticillatus]